MPAIRLVLLVAMIAAMALGSVLAGASASAAADAGVPASSTSATTAALATTVGVIESELTQLADGRTTLKNTLGALTGCTVSPASASRRLATVIANRTGISSQLASLPAPTAESARVKTLLQNALYHSLAADRHYRDWVASLQSRPRCSTSATADLTAAEHEDELATAAKQTFVVAFDPLARRLHLRSWKAAEI
jgi:hypothetical protein